MTRVVVAMGSNIDPERCLPAAVRMLSSRCQVLAVSNAYESTPVGTTGQSRFLNAAVLIEWSRSPLQLKEGVLCPIEAALGRVRTADKNAARTIDLDITLYGESDCQVGGRMIPDPDLLIREHVAVPVSQLCPGFRHPTDGRTLAKIAQSLDTGDLVPRPDVDLRQSVVTMPKETDNAPSTS